MTERDEKPIIYLAIANSAVRPLPKLDEEFRRLSALFERAAMDDLCQLVTSPYATVDDVLDTFQDARYRNRIAVFHFAGHADSTHLLLQAAEGRHIAADAAGLAAFLHHQEGLELVFLNACSTQPQVQRVLDAGVAMVVATSQAIDDAVATDFALRFYTGLAGGASVESAFQQAEAGVQTKHSGQTRNSYLVDEQGDRVETMVVADDRWPWQLYQQPGTSRAERWSLPDISNQPLFGIPPLPEMDLPERPFRHLAWFDRAHSPVFFGRGYQIRELYQLVTQSDAPPIILFYGETGVGKSSLLDAGLLPRLERDYTVIYVRRDERKGLLKTLLDALPGDHSHGDLRRAWETVEAGTAKPLLVVLDQVEEFYTRPHSATPGEMDAFLDGLEDIFSVRELRPKGKLILGFRKEWLADLKQRLDDRNLPSRGMFLQRLDRRGIEEAVSGVAESKPLHDHYGLTVDEELPAIIADDLLGHVDSPVAPTLQVLLTKLWEAGIRANPDSPSFTVENYQALRRQGILLQDFLNQQMARLAKLDPEVVASGLALDLLAFHTTNLATAAQRTKTEVDEAYRHRSEVLPELIQEAMDAYLLADVDPDQNRSVMELASASGPVRITTLAHDALGPLVRRQFDESDLPGQRARRILESRAGSADDDVTPLGEADLLLVEAGQPGMRAWTDEEEHLVRISCERRNRRQRNRHILYATGAFLILCITVLGSLAFWQWGVARAQTNAANAAAQRASDEADRAIKAEGTAVAQATRADDEAANAAKSAADANEARIEAENQATEAERQREEATRAALQSRIREIVAQIKPLLAQEVFDPSLTLLLALEALKTAQSGQDQVARLEADDLLQRTMAEIEGMGWRMTLPREAHAGEVMAASFSPDGETVLTAGEDQSARLWDASTGHQVVLFAGHKGPVFDAEFSPDGQRVATAGQDGKVRIWATDSGEQLDQFDLHDDRVRTVAFDSTGTRLVTASQDGTSKIADAESGAVLHELRHGQDVWVLSARFSPDDAWVVTTSNDNTARLWRTDGGELAYELPHSAWVRNATFSPDGKRLITVSQDGKVSAWTVPEDGALGAPEVTDYPPHVFSSGPKDVNDAAFSDDGSLLVTVAHRGQIYLRDGLTGAVIRQMQGHSDGVLSVDFSSDGKSLVTSSSDGHIRIWQVMNDRTLKEQVLIGGHTEGLQDIAFSPDSRKIATAGDDDVIRIWDVDTGSPVQSLRAHTDTVRSLAYGPNGDWLVSAGDNAAVLVWDLSGGEVRSLRGFTGTVHSVAVSPDGTEIVAGGEPATARIWSVEDGTVIHSLTAHTDTVTSVAYSPNGSRILTGSEDGTIRLWNSATWEEIATYRRHNESVQSVAFSPDGRHFASGGSDDVAFVWNVFTGEVEFELSGLHSTVDSVAYSPDGEYLIAATNNDAVRVWDVLNRVEVRTLLGHDGTVRAARFSPDGVTIATAGKDGTAKLWDHGESAHFRAFKANTAHQRFVAFSPDDRFILSAGQKPQAQLWDASTGQELHSLVGHTNAVWSAEFDPLGDAALTASQDGTIGLWNLATGVGITMTVPVSNPKSLTGSDLEDLIGVQYAGFSPEGERFVTTGNDRIVRLWDTATLTVTRALAGHTGPVLHAAFDPGGRLLATGSADGTARLWQLQTGQIIHELDAHEWVRSVAFDPDAKSLATAGGDGIVRIWDVDSGRQIMSLQLENQAPPRKSVDFGLVSSVQFSPRGEFLLTTGEDHTARIWDAGDGHLVRELSAYDTEVWHASFSHDGKTIVTASYDGILRLWDTDVEGTVSRARSLIQRDPPLFTEQERATYNIDN